MLRATTRLRPIGCSTELRRAGGNWQRIHIRERRDDIALGIRHLIVGEYLILYRAGEHAIEIVRVLYGRRDLAADDIT